MPLYGVHLACKFAQPRLIEPSRRDAKCSVAAHCFCRSASPISLTGNTRCCFCRSASPIPLTGNPRCCFCRSASPIPLTGNPRCCFCRSASHVPLTGNTRCCFCRSASHVPLTGNTRCCFCRSPNLFTQAGNHGRIRHVDAASHATSRHSIPEHNEAYQNMAKHGEAWRSTASGTIVGHFQTCFAHSVECIRRPVRVFFGQAEANSQRTAKPFFAELLRWLPLRPSCNLTSRPAS